MKIRSLTIRITIVVTIMTLFVLLATMTSTYIMSLNNHRKQADRETNYRLDLVVERLNKVQTSVELAASYSIPALKACMTDTAKVVEILNTIVASNSYVNCAALAYAPNRLPNLSYCMPIAVDEGTVSHYFSDRDLNGEYIYDDWYIAPALDGKSFWTDPHYNLLNVPVVSYAVPVISEERGFEGVLTLAVELTNLNKMLSLYQYEDGDASAQTVSVVLDRNTTFLTTRTRDLILNETLFTLAESTNDTVHSHIGHEILAERNGEAVLNLNGERSVATWRVLPELHWAAMVITPYSEVYASVYELTYSNIIIALLAIIAAIIILFFSVRRALRPFNQLKSATHQVGEGKYDVELPARLVERPDEIGDLGREFMLMQKAVKKTIDELDAERQLLKNSYDMLSTLLHNVVSQLRLPVTNMLNFHEVLGALLGDNDDVRMMQQEAKRTASTILDRFNQLNELSNLISSKPEDDDTLIVLSSADFVLDFIKGAHQLEEHYPIKLNEESLDDRKLDIRCNTHILEKLLYELIIEASRVSNTDTIGLRFTLNEKMTALRIAIVAETDCPIPEDEKPNFFVRFAKQKVDAYATSTLLPLYICSRIAERLGISLYVEPGSEANRKANVFIIDIPKASF